MGLPQRSLWGAHSSSWGCHGNCQSRCPGSSISNMESPTGAPDSDLGHVELRRITLKSRTPEGSASVSSAWVTDRLRWSLRLSSALGLPAPSQAPAASCAPGLFDLEPRGRGLAGGRYCPRASTVQCLRCPSPCPTRGPLLMLPCLETMARVAFLLHTRH